MPAAAKQPAIAAFGYKRRPGPEQVKLRVEIDVPGNWFKNLKSQISAIQSDISKHKEQKEECIKSRLLESGIITDNTARSMRGYTSIS